jgi:hypothetical protein
MPSDQKLDEFGTLQLLWGDAIIDAIVSRRKECHQGTKLTT